MEEKMSDNMIEAAVASYKQAFGSTAPMGLGGCPSHQTDPWAHRSQGMRCQTCMWFVHKVTTSHTTGSNKLFGRCRRHAPTMTGYPAVYGTDWCGDHKLDEAKA